jgi:voltage-gated potassium channel
MRLERSTISIFQCFILLLSVYVLAALFIQTVIVLPPDTSILLDRIDFAICLVFIYDFFLRLYRAPSKSRFLRWGWIDLVSSIPMFDALRWGRLVRVVRIFRVLRAFRSTKVLLSFLFRNRAQSTFAAVALITAVLVIFSTLAILTLEDSPDANIKTPGDALWWAFATVSTVGYGDKFPVSTEGKIIAAVLMTAGVGFFGTFTAYVASFFIEAEQQKEASEIHQLIEEVKLLRAKIELLEDRAERE